MTSTPDPLAAIQSVFQTNVSYASDDSTPVTETFANNGFDVELFPFGRKKQRLSPLIEVGPASETIVKPQNIGDSPNSRWLYQYLVEVHLYTQTYSSPNISGYNGKTKITESIRQVLIQKQSSIDGSGNWLLMTLSSGPKSGPDTTVTPDRYETIFIVKLQRSVVN
ncbi:MAG: hypothetical protein ACREBQ_08875 [Nitrososphaerales archaeon]